MGAEVVLSTAAAKMYWILSKIQDEHFIQFVKHPLL